MKWNGIGRTALKRYLPSPVASHLSASLLSLHGLGLETGGEGQEMLRRRQ